MQISLDGISKQFGGYWALENVSLQLEPGQVVALLGPNGAGKTTLLNCLAGIVRPSQGKVNYDSEVFHRGRMDLRRRMMYLPDSPMLFARMNVLRHIAMCILLYERPNPDEQRVVEILDRLDLLPLATVPIGRMSRGQMYKSALAALLTIDPELWILDEPMASGMDPMGIAYFKHEARLAAKRGRTVIYTTQILEIAEKFSDRVCILDHGGMRLSGKVEDLRQSGNAQSLEELFLRLSERAEED
jgi:ABC-type multidrug transport system ATPase subunit